MIFYHFLALQLKCHLYHHILFIFYSPIFSFKLLFLVFLPILKAENDSHSLHHKNTSFDSISSLNAKVSWFKYELWNLADLGLSFYIRP